MPETKLSLHRKLAQVMYEAERIPKNGTAPAVMGGYKFVQVGDAADYIRKALAEKIITMMPVAVNVVGQVDRATKNGGNMTTLDLVTTWRLTDGESGETIEIQSFGAGADAGDKYSGKAMTSAMKYALLSGFLLSTGEDTEGATIPEQRNAPAQVTVPARAPSHEATNDGGLVGIAQLGEAPADYGLREEPEGWALSFKLMDGKKGFRVVARDDLAQALALIQSDVIGQRVICYGRMGTASMIKGNTTINYNVLELDRIETPSVVLPAPLGAVAGPSQTEAAGGVMSPSSAAPTAAEWDAEIAALPIAQ